MGWIRRRAKLRGLHHPTTKGTETMKRLLSAVAVTFALAAQANAQSFPDGYTPLSAEDLKPIAGARSEWEIRKDFPKGSFRHHPTLTPQDLQPIAGARSHQELMAGAPQPSFRDYTDTVTAGGSTALATIESNRAN
jgi:hypothetical protein